MLWEFGALQERIDRKVKRIGELEEELQEYQKMQELYRKVLEKLEGDIKSGDIYKYLDFYNEDILRMPIEDAANRILNLGVK